MTLFAIVGLNCVFGYSTQHIANELHRFAVHHGTKLPNLSVMALSVPPWFYAIAAIALALAVFGGWSKMAERKLVYTIVALLFLDIGGLFILLGGVGVPFFVIGNPI